MQFVQYNQNFNKALTKDPKNNTESFKNTTVNLILYQLIDISRPNQLIMTC
jgi:hypothetical protein